MVLPRLDAVRLEAARPSAQSPRAGPALRVARMARTWPDRARRRPAPATGVPAQAGRPGPPSKRVRLDAFRLEAARPSAQSPRAGPALRGWPGPGPVVRDCRQRDPPALEARVRLDALRLEVASPVHRHCGASWPARPALEACAPRCVPARSGQALRSIGQGRTGAERMARTRLGRARRPPRSKHVCASMRSGSKWPVRSTGVAAQAGRPGPRSKRVRLEAFRLEAARPSVQSPRAGPALRGWPGPGPVVRDGRQRDPPALEARVRLDALRLEVANPVHRRCGASWPARPALETCAARCSPAATVQALRSIAQGRTGAERMARTRPGRARRSPARSARARSTCAPRCAPARSGQSGPPALRRKLAGQARARSVCASMRSGSKRPGPPFNRPGQDRR